jgi:hypothetical protein
MVVMKHTYLRSAVLCLGMLLAAYTMFAQTYPTPWDLSSGNYSITSWANSSTAGTYPASMVFHTFLDRIEPFAGAYNQTPNGNWALAYNLSSGPRINGRDAAGIEFTQTGTAQAGNCSFVGAAVLSVRTIGRAGVNVSFKAKTVSVQPRPYVLRLQYRIGNSGNWVEAVGTDGGYIEHRSLSNGTSVVNYTYSMPVALENQTEVQLRWLYFQDGAGSGNRPSIQLDDVAVTSTPIAGTPTNLWLTSMSPLTPSANIPFTIIVRSTDNSGAPKNVSANTTVTLWALNGTGTLSGTVTGIIPSGMSTVVFSNVVYDTPEAGVSIYAAVTAGPSLADYTTQPFSVGSGAAYAVVSGAQTYAFAGVVMNPMTVTLYKADNTVDVNYTSNLTISKTSGAGTLSGTTTVTPYRGVAVFDNVSLSTAGSVTLQVTMPGLPSQTLPLTNVFGTPTLTTNVVPQYVSSRTLSGTCTYNAFPIPSYASVTFNNLQPNTVYRYNVGGASGGPLTSTGGGFNIHYNANTNTYSYSTSKSLTDFGAYSEFSTGAGQTSKAIWINLVPSNNIAFAEFAPVYWRVALGDGQGRLINHYQLSQPSVAQRMGNLSTDATLLGERTSDMPALNFVLVYDNTTGTGSPIGVSIVQAYNTTVSGATNRYRFDVENMPGAWMVQVPNSMTLGIRRIEYRSYETNQILYAVTSPDGKWNGISTNPGDLTAYPSGPGGFTSPIYLETPRITVSSPVANDTLCSGSIASITYRAEGITSVMIEYSTNNGISWELIASDVPVAGSLSSANNGSYNWFVPGVGLNPTNFLVRVTGINRADISGTTARFTVVEPLAVILDLKSKNLCLDDNDTLIVITSGSIQGYQWYKDGNPIPGTNSPVLNLTDVQYGSSGVYTVRVFGFGRCGDVVSGPAHIRVSRKTAIVNQTFAVPGIVGETVQLWVEAEVPGDVVDYQWYKGQTALSDDGHYYGTSSNRLEIRNFSNDDYGNDYYCVVTGVCMSATSRMIRVFPTGVFAEFRTDPAYACQGSNIELTADVYSNPSGEALQMKWYRNNVALSDGPKYSGVSTPNLTISNVTSLDAGVYTVKAWLVIEPALNDEATVSLEIASEPLITNQPVNADVCENEAVTLSVSASAQGSITYQWFKDNTPIPGAKAQDFVIDDVSATSAGSYTVQVTTACGNVMSDIADLTVKDLTVITQQPPAAVDANINYQFMLMLAATGSGTIQYQWFKDGVELTGEVTTMITRVATSQADAGKYWCRVQAECGEVISDTTVVTVDVTTSVTEEVRTGALVSQVMPNPVDAFVSVTISLKNESDVTITLVNATGLMVKSINVEKMSVGTVPLMIDVSDLSSGMYVLQITAGAERSVQTFVVVR